jgi:hypothetical protein
MVCKPALTWIGGRSNGSTVAGHLPGGNPLDRAKRYYALRKRSWLR